MSPAVIAAGSTSFPFVGSVATLNIGNANLSPDGFERPSSVVNGVFPAPLIKANKGDHFSLNVVNDMTDDTQFRATSIHWHGIYQKHTNWADGVAGVNQCPIGPGDSFLYQFDVPNQAGTFWYHSHFRTQYCDGLRGPLVIYDPEDPYRDLYDVDDENTVITIGDWYHLQSPSITGVASNDATVINGKGRYVGGPLVDLAIINVVPGKRYRLRIMAISCDPNYIFSIDGHQLTVIEADAQSTQPLVVDSIQIFAGQRYSAILTADQPIGNYWIRALPNSGNNNLFTGFIDGTNSAILRYAGAPIADPTTSAPDAPVLLDETLLVPLDTTPVPGQPFPGGADVNLLLNLDFNVDAWRFYVNNETFNPPTVPVLLQVMSGAVAAQDLLPAGSVYTLPPNASVEISIPGGVISSPHPFHLHGHSFSVVKSAGIDTPYNYVNPVKRDVVSTGDVGSNTTIRFFTDNSGPWILHCHIDWHLDLGLAIVLAEDPVGTPALNPTPQDWDDLCPAYDALDPSMTEIAVVATPSPLDPQVVSVPESYLATSTEAEDVTVTVTVTVTEGDDAAATDSS
uniref:Laccase 8 n=2 Tax=Coprinopsis cinerea TaxID=5346 RepID=Q08AB9_COPC7|nr:laccase 8 [Coprinopsis cinerea]DAA04513.1 TPA_exp: laccase 8 [Coprinopsis cinerea okayama7\